MSAATTELEAQPAGAPAVNHRLARYVTARWRWCRAKGAELQAPRAAPGLAGAGLLCAAVGGVVAYWAPWLGVWAGLGLAAWFLLRLDSRIGPPDGP